jgi:hypothetical protein
MDRITNAVARTDLHAHVDGEKRAVTTGELIHYLNAEWGGHQEKFIKMDLTIDLFREVILTRGMHLDNVDRFVRKWSFHHPENKDMRKMWELFCIQRWDRYYSITHLSEYFKYGIMQLVLDHV